RARERGRLSWGGACSASAGGRAGRGRVEGGEVGGAEGGAGQGCCCGGVSRGSQ
ncbi:hypothetical protein P7K49_012347, partial [Saguinus oedipus]